MISHVSDLYIYIYIYIKTLIFYKIVKIMHGKWQVVIYKMGTKKMIFF